MSYVIGDGREMPRSLDFVPDGSRNWDGGTCGQRFEGLTDKGKGLDFLQQECELEVQAVNLCQQQQGTLDSEAPGNSGQEASDI